MSAHDHHDEYGETFVAGLEWMWSEVIEDELATLTGDNHPRLDERLGPEAAAQRLDSTSKKIIVDGGELRPGHLRARRPA